MPKINYIEDATWRPVYAISATPGYLDAGLGPLVKKYYDAGAGHRTGPNGRAYALPVCFGEDSQSDKAWNLLQASTQDLFDHVKSNPDAVFCLYPLFVGITQPSGACEKGLTDIELRWVNQFARNRPKNLMLPGVYRHALDEQVNFVSVSGDHELDDPHFFVEKMEKALDRAGIAHSNLVLCTTDLSGAGELTQQFGMRNHIPTLVFRHNSAVFGRFSRYFVHHNLLNYSNLTVLFGNGENSFWSSVKKLSIRYPVSRHFIDRNADLFAGLGLADPNSACDSDRSSQSSPS